LGLGKMGSILLQALLKQKLFLPKNSVATVRHPGRAKRLSDELGIDVGTDNRAAARNADIVLICVKPQTVPEVCEDIRAAVDPSKLVVSVAASVLTRSIEKLLSADIPVVRAMPNTPCSVGEGMTAISRGRFAEPHHLELSERIFNTVGRTARIDEKYLDAVTGLSASGPAFIYIILESLAEAGVKLGLPREVATLLVAQTMLGSARQVLETGDHPALLKDAVTTPAGCTIDGIMELEEGKLRVTLIKAVVKAADRAKDLYEED
ncbi:MAG: pyrroline-5-carboxylate reductase, partial [Vicinamibacteria bacterium]